MINMRTETTPMVEILERTVKVWKAKLGKEPEDLEFGGSACPLCVKYIKNEGCDGCPISTYTGSSTCENSPYDDVLDILHLIRLKEISKEKLQPYLAAEISFLENLLHIYKLIETQELRMELATLKDNTYYLSDAYENDKKILDYLKTKTVKEQENQQKGNT